MGLARTVTSSLGFPRSYLFYDSMDSNPFLKLFQNSQSADVLTTESQDLVENAAKSPRLSVPLAEDEHAFLRNIFSVTLSVGT